MKVGVEQLETEITPLAERHGLSVYDLEVIAFGRPTLRVYVERLKPDPGVTIGELETFAKVLIPYLSLKGLFPREGHIEVSSPGLNRKLRRPTHFTAAVGQSIDVTAANEAGKRTITARLLSVTDDGIHLENEQMPYVPFASIVRAQVQPDIRL